MYSEAWEPVIAHMPRLRGVARKMARIDNRLDASELLHELVADVVQNSHLYDAARGPWMVWASTRAWLARTRALRILARHEPRGLRAEFVHEPEDDKMQQYPLAPGAWGSNARSEAGLDLQAVWDAVEIAPIGVRGEDPHDIILDEIYGLGSSCSRGFNLRRLADHVRSDLGFRARFAARRSQAVCHG